MQCGVSNKAIMVVIGEIGLIRPILHGNESDLRLGAISCGRFWLCHCASLNPVLRCTTVVFKFY